MTNSYLTFNKRGMSVKNIEHPGFTFDEGKWLDIHGFTNFTAAYFDPKCHAKIHWPQDENRSKIGLTTDRFALF